MNPNTDVSNPLAAEQVPVPTAAPVAQPGDQSGNQSNAVDNPMAAPSSAPTASSPSADNSPMSGGISNPLGQPAKPSQPAAPGPPKGSFAAKLLQAIGGVLTGVTNAAQVGAAPDPTAELNRQNQLKQQALQNRREAQDRQDRLTQEQRIQKREDDEAAARIAESNVRQHQMRHADYILGQQQIDSTIAQGQKDLKSMTGSEVPAQVLQSGVSGDQMNSLLQLNGVNTHEYTAIPTGKKLAGKDADGNFTYDYTYDIVKLPDTWEPTDDQITRIKTVPGYKEFQKGTKMDPSRVLSVLSQADQMKTTNDMTDASRADAKLGKLTTEQKNSTAEFIKSGDWLRYLNAYHGNAVQAATHMLSDHDMAKKYSTSLYPDVMKQFATEKDPTGVTGFETMRHQYEQEGEARFKDAKEALGQLPGGGAMTDEMKANITALPKDKQAVVNQYDSPTKASLYSIAFGPGDLDFDKTFPNRVSAKSGQLDSAHALGVIRQLNPNFSPGQYKMTQKAYQNVTFGRNGQDVETYNNLLEHMAKAQDVIEGSLRSANPKFLNSAINLAENEGWGTEATNIQTALEPVKTEFESLMNNGHALHADQQKLYDAMISPSMTPAQLEQAFKNFGATGVVRLEGLNDQYKKIAGKNVPGIVRKNALEAAKHLALDDKTMKQLGQLNSGDFLFNNPDWTPGTREEQQQTADTATQQKEAMKQSAIQTAQEAFKSGKAPAGAKTINLGSDGAYWYLDSNNMPMARVQ